jgi:hypothetical protein
MTKILIDEAVVRQALEWFDWLAESDAIEAPIPAPTVRASLRQALADAALDKKADNAKELGLSYEQPAQWGVHQQLALNKMLEQPAQQEPVAWGNFKEDGTLVGLSQHPEDQANWTGRCPLYTTPPAAAQSLTAVLKAAQGVLEWTEIAHRPPVRDKLEAGRMVMVRLHALADLHDALAAHGITKGNI